MTTETEKKLKCWEQRDYQITTYSHALFGKMNRYSNDPFITQDDYQKFYLWKINSYNPNENCSGHEFQSSDQYPTDCDRYY